MKKTFIIAAAMAVMSTAPLASMNEASAMSPSEGRNAAAVETPAAAAEELPSTKESQDALDQIYHYARMMQRMVAFAAPFISAEEEFQSAEPDEADKQKAVSTPTETDTDQYPISKIETKKAK